MDQEHEAFYVVRKGNTIGIYRNLTDCQAQVSPSVCDPSVSVYKGYSLHKETEEYLASHGLKEALYTVDAKDIKEDMFGKLVPCPFQEVAGSTSISTWLSNSSLKLGNSIEVQPVSSNHVSYAKNNLKLGDAIEAHPVSSKYMTCILQFDGASKGNPGKAGAGAVLRTEDGRVISRLCEGLGVVTNNVAEYRAIILGMKYALKKGFRRICVQGDSQLVCMQVKGLWQTKHQNMIALCKEVQELKDKFLSFQINHVKREFNSDADAQANLAITLPIGEVYEECGEGF